MVEFLTKVELSEEVGHVVRGSLIMCIVNVHVDRLAAGSIMSSVHGHGDGCGSRRSGATLLATVVVGGESSADVDGRVVAAIASCGFVKRVEATIVEPAVVGGGDEFLGRTKVVGGCIIIVAAADDSVVCSWLRRELGSGNLDSSSRCVISAVRKWRRRSGSLGGGSGCVVRVVREWRRPGVVDDQGRRVVADDVDEGGKVN